MKTALCDVISGGLAMGRALNCSYLHKVDKLNSNDIMNEVKRLDDAIFKSISQLEEIKNKATLVETTAFIDSHISILKDLVFYQEIVNYVCEQKCNIEYAYQICIDRYIENLKNVSHDFLRERALDIVDVKSRVMSNFFNQTLELKAKRGTILFVDELLPTQVLNLSTNIRGVVAASGGKTSHSAILCNSLGITYVVCDCHVADNESIIIDPNNNVVVINPDDTTLLEYEYLFFDKDIDDSFISKNPGPYKIKANISSNKEIKKVVSNRLNGVGLYRTEFLFMAKGHVSLVEEQRAIYEEASKGIYPNDVIIRTFDIGDDKNLPYLLLDKKTANNYFKYLSIFENQVRAIVQANILGNLKIMFPMIESINQFNDLKDIVLKISEEEGIKIEIGMMIETKMAIDNIATFGGVNFMSIGTNDLMSELYGINRLTIQNYDIYIDDLLNRLKLVVAFCDKNSIELSLCGEMGSYEKYLLRFMDLGIKIFSVNVSAISNVIKVISKRI